MSKNTPRCYFFFFFWHTILHHYFLATAVSPLSKASLAHLCLFFFVCVFFFRCTLHLCRINWISWTENTKRGGIWYFYFKDHCGGFHQALTGVGGVGRMNVSDRIRTVTGISPHDSCFDREIWLLSYIWPNALFAFYTRDTLSRVFRRSVLFSSILNCILFKPFNVFKS